LGCMPVRCMLGWVWNSNDCECEKSGGGLPR
jgi:hypothetical protein